MDVTENLEGWLRVMASAPDAEISNFARLVGYWIDAIVSIKRTVKNATPKSNGWGTSTRKPLGPPYGWASKDQEVTKLWIF